MSERVHGPLVELTRARLLEFLREPEAVFWTFVFPLVLAFALGIAFRSQGREPVFAGVVSSGEATAPAAGADLAALLERSADIRVRRLSPPEADRALRDGEVQVVVRPGNPPTYRFDPTRPESQRARLVVDAVLQQAAGRVDRFAPRLEPLELVGSRYIDWLVPGLLGLNIMGTSMWSIGFSVVWARSRRVLKRLAATPMRRRDYLLAQMLARLVFLVLEAGGLLVFAAWMFSVPIRGSLVTVSGVVLLGSLAFGGLGLLVASRVQTIEAVSGWMNFSMVPMWVVSGVFFTSAHFPAAAQPFIHALPLTALNDALRAVMLDGAAPRAITGELAILAAWCLGCFAIALRIFRWK